MAESDNKNQELDLLNASINLAQNYSSSDPKQCVSSVYDVAKEIVYQVCRALYKRDDHLPYEMTLSALQDSDVVQPDIFERMKRIPEYLKAGPDKIPQCLFELEKIVFWFYQVYLVKPIPEEIREFIIQNHDLPEEGLPELTSETVPQISPGEPLPELKEPESALEFKRNYRLPEYVKRLVDLNSIISLKKDRETTNQARNEINEIYDAALIKDDINRAIFFLLCFRLSQTKKPITFHSFSEFVLTWSQTENAKNLRNFPATPTTINTTLEVFFSHLAERKILLDLTYEGFGRLIALSNLDKNKEIAEQDMLKKILTLLSAELNQAFSDTEYPYPTVKTLQKQLQRDNIKIAELISETITYEEMDENLLQARVDGPVFLVYLPDSSEEPLLMSQAGYSRLPMAAVQKVYAYFGHILTEFASQNNDSKVLNRINSLLRKSFPNDNLSLKKLISPERTRYQSIWSVDDPDLHYWLFIFHNLNEGGRDVLPGQNPLEISILQNIPILNQIVTKRHEIRKNREAANQFRDNLVKELESLRKLSRREIQERWNKQFQKEGDGVDVSEKVFAGFMESLLQEYSVRKKPEGFVTELPIIHPRTRQMEYYYAYSHNLLTLFRENLDKVVDKHTGIREAAFIRRLTEVLQTNEWASDSQAIIHALDTDDDFARYLAEFVRDNYNELYVLDQVFESNIEILRYLVQINADKTGRYFNKLNQKKPLFEMIGVTRLDVLKQMRSRTGLFSRLITWLLGLLPFFRGLLGTRNMLQQILKEQLKTSGISGAKRHDIPGLPSGTAGRPQFPATATSKPPSAFIKNAMGMLFQAKPVPGVFKYSSKAQAGQKKDAATPELRMKEKITQFKKALLQQANMNRDSDYLSYFADKWRVKNVAEESSVQEILYRKDVNQNINWFVSIKRDFPSMKNLDDYLEIINDVTKGIAGSLSNRHLNKTALSSYLALYILSEMEKNIG